MLKFCKLLLVVILMGSLSFGEIIGGYAADFFDYGVGGRPFAMGGAGRTVVNDASAGYWNSGLLAAVVDPSGIYMSTKIMDETEYTFLAGSFPLNEKEVIALSYLDLKLNDLELHPRGTSPTVQPLGYFNVVNSALMLSYSKIWDENLDVGVTGKLGSRKVYNHNDGVLSFDLGAVYRKDSWAVGGNIKNLFSLHYGDASDDKFELDLDVGASYTWENFLFSLDLARFMRGGFTYYAGVEYGLVNFREVIDVKLRGGMNSNEMALGVGVLVVPVSIDYSYLIRSMTQEHLFSITVQFDDNAKKKAPRLLYQKALKKLEEGNLPLAEFYAKQGLEMYLDIPEIRDINRRLWYGVGFLKRKILAKAEPHDKQLMEEAIHSFIKGKDLKSLEILEYLRRKYIKERDVDKFRKLVEKESKKVFKHRGQDFISIYKKAAAAAVLLQDIGKSKDLLEKVIYLEPNDYDALKRLGSNYYYLDRKDEAVLLWKRAQNIEPNDQQLKILLEKARLGTLTKLEVLMPENLLKEDTFDEPEFDETEAEDSVEIEAPEFEVPAVKIPSKIIESPIMEGIEEPPIDGQTDAQIPEAIETPEIGELESPELEAPVQEQVPETVEVPEVDELEIPNVEAPVEQQLPESIEAPELEAPVQEQGPETMEVPEVDELEIPNVEAPVEQQLPESIEAPELEAPVQEQGPETMEVPEVETFEKLEQPNLEVIEQAPEQIENLGNIEEAIEELKIAN